MKIVLIVFRIVVGMLFIFSGLVKANDPIGLSYKMQEFFEVWKLHGFNSWTLTMSVLMNAFEIIAGFAILIGWRPKSFAWLLLILIVFFSFLTGYTFVTGKPKNCGCFGDCLIISSKTSFLKDVLLTLLIGFLLWQHKKIKSLFSQKISMALMLLIAAFSFGIQWYALNYLPFVDCLPYKKGNNITEKMKVPANAIPDSIVVSYTYKKDGKIVEFSATDFPEDFNDSLYSYIDRHDRLVREGKNNLPPIHGFSLKGITGEDSTAVVLQEPAAILLFCENLSNFQQKWFTEFKQITIKAAAKKLPVYIVTNDFKAVSEKFSSLNLPIFSTDYTAIRTAARTNPTLYFLENGTITNKWSYHKFSDALKKM